jgi:hypothetical protein
VSGARKVADLLKGLGWLRIVLAAPAGAIGGMTRASTSFAGRCWTAELACAVRIRGPPTAASSSDGAALGLVKMGTMHPQRGRRI